MWCFLRQTASEVVRPPDEHDSVENVSVFGRIGSQQRRHEDLMEGGGDAALRLRRRRISSFADDNIHFA